MEEVPRKVGEGEVRIDISDGYVWISNMTQIQYNIIREWNMTRWIRQEQALRGDITLELLNSLAELTTLPPNVEKVRARLHDRYAALETERAASEPTPMYDYPVKRKLFKHQIRGANMAMIAFGEEVTPPISKEDRGFGFLFEMG